LVYRQLQLTEDIIDENVFHLLLVREALLILSDELSATFPSTKHSLLKATFKTARYESISELMASIEKRE